MKSLYFYLLALIAMLFIGCEQKIEKRTQVSMNPGIGEGEWLNASDTVNGLSIRGNKIAFFKNMQFDSDQIFEYVIVDSIYKTHESKKIMGEYLVMTKDQDSLVLRIRERNSKKIVLLDSNERPTVYKFWKRLTFNTD
ncbi:MULTISPECIES: hypothetical protein [unclassified Flavobacterium]|uniref:hypothetical protein n=1 Tax=unclassified Flavobacterium TaxID=196869 RepID=UPI001F13BDBF|nr:MULTISPECIES: hypothetical protein [unclassified Flavobacterium]UMY64549.1 hypothetical protein MKO97_08495 [Flavobacterium sp. HJ-32-4]